MALNIEKMRADMAWETRKFVVSIVLSAAALVGAGVAIGNYVSRQPPTPQSITVHLDAPLIAPKP